MTPKQRRNKLGLALDRGYQLREYLEQLVKNTPEPDRTTLLICQELIDRGLLGLANVWRKT